LAQLSQQVEDLVAGRQVEVAGRLVCEDQHRFHGQGPGDRYPLHLASRQRVWSMVTPMGESQAVEEGGSSGQRLAARPPRDKKRKGNIFNGGEGRDEVEGLEHKTHVGKAETGKPDLI